MSAPKRRHVLTLDIHADDAEHLRMCLEELLGDLSDRDQESTFGSPSCGGNWKHVVNQEQTPSKYREQLDAYLEKLAEKP